MTVLKAKIGGQFQSVLSGYASNVYVGPNPPTDPNIEFWVDTDATLPVVPWTPISTFTGTWSNFGTPFTLAGYRKIGDIVEVRGIVKNTASLTLGTMYPLAPSLPAGFRPSSSVMFVSATLEGGSYMSARVDVTNGGDLQVTPAFTGVVTYMSLDTIRFSVTA